MTDAPKRRPWWAAAMAGGFGAVLGTGALFGFAGTRHGEPVVAAAVAAPLPSDVSERLAHMELVLANQTETLAEVRERLARIEGRLERR